MKVNTSDPRMWTIHASYSPALTAAARTVPGMAWAPTEKCWAGPPAAVRQVLAALAARGIRVEVPPPPMPPKDWWEPKYFDGLRGYQQEGARFLLTHERALLADDMGIGKSAQAIIAARNVGGRTLVVCPNISGALPRQWVEYLKRWWPSAKVQRLTGTRGGEIATDDVVVCHYEILHAWAESLAEWTPQTVIFDEAHALMNENSVRSQAARVVAEKAPYRWGLTGTPLTNRPRDLWNVVDVLRPGEFGSFFTYGVRYCDGHKEQVTPTKTVWKFDGASRLEELRERLAAFTLRRTAADVGLELPAKTRELMRVTVPARARLAYTTNATALRRALDASADAKLPAVIEAVLTAVAGGSRVVAFCWRRAIAEAVADAARARGLPAEVVHGGLSSGHRLLALERARRAGPGVLACTVDAASTGIDLSYANLADFVELTWEPHKLLQAEARLHRFGAHAPVLVRYWLGVGTGDELIADTVIRKLDVYARTLGGGKSGLDATLRASEVDVLAELDAALADMAARGARTR